MTIYRSINAAAEALNKLYKKELIWRRAPLHPYCGDIPPAEFERSYYAEVTTTPATASPVQPALH